LHLEKNKFLIENELKLTNCLENKLKNVKRSSMFNPNMTVDIIPDSESNYKNRYENSDFFVGGPVNIFYH